MSPTDCLTQTMNVAASRWRTRFSWRSQTLAKPTTSPCGAPPGTQGTTNPPAETGNPLTTPHEKTNPADELLSAFLDGELAPDERAAVEQRIEADPEARLRLEGLRAASSTLRSLPPATAPSGLGEAVTARLATPDNQGHAAEPPVADRRLPFGRSRRGWAWAVAAVAASLLVVALTQDNEAPQELAKLPAAAGEVAFEAAEADNTEVTNEASRAASESVVGALAAESDAASDAPVAGAGVAFSDRRGEPPLPPLPVTPPIAAPTDGL
ncbi:MAG: zf-HC2 domain-containing protein, partial [Planctomycetota bacterium]